MCSPFIPLVHKQKYNKIRHFETKRNPNTSLKGGKQCKMHCYPCINHTGILSLRPVDVYFACPCTEISGILMPESGVISLVLGPTWDSGGGLCLVGIEKTGKLVT